MTATTLAEHLAAGGDPTQLKGYRLLLDELVAIATSGDDPGQRVALHRWQPFDIDHDGPFGAWASVADWRAHAERCIELVESEALRHRLMAALPDADRLTVERGIAELREPAYAITLEHAGAPSECQTCGAGIDGSGQVVRVGERGGRSADDVVMCVPCVCAVVPASAPVWS